MNAIAEAIEMYKSEQQDSLDRLIQVIQPKLEEACRKWGFVLYSGYRLGERNWCLDFMKEAPPTAHQYLHTESRHLLSFLEPELFAALELMFAQNIQRSTRIIPEIRISEDDCEWVILRVAEDEFPSILTDDQILDVPVANDDQYEPQYFGWIPRQIAEEIITLDADKSFEAISYLPEIRNISGLLGNQD